MRLNPSLKNEILKVTRGRREEVQRVDTSPSHSPHTVQRLGLLYSLFILLVPLIDLALRQVWPEHWILLLYAFLSMVLAARYRFWMKRWFSDTAAVTHLAWLVLGASLALIMSLLVQGRSVLFFLLVASEGYLILSFKRPFWGKLWFLALTVLAAAVYAFLYDWGAAVELLLQSAPFAVVVLAALDLFLDEQSLHKTVEPISREPAQTNPWPESYRDYITKVEALAVSRERARIAREFHDTLGHTLTALDVQMELVARLPAEQIEDIQQAAQQARALVKEGLADVRRSIQALQPAALESFSAVEAIHSLVTAFEHSTQLTTRWQVEGKATPLPPELALPLYRTAQEALTNVRRHANASLVKVTLVFAPDSVTLVVEDNGAVEATGAGHPATNGGFGLRGIRSRVEELHGKFYAGPEPAGGFRVEMKLPC